MEEVGRQLTTLGPGRGLLVCSDARSPESLRFHFGYRPPPRLTLVYAGALSAQMLAEADTVWVFVHRERSAFLAYAYGTPSHDAAIEALQLPVALEGGQVVLFEAGDGTVLRPLLASQAPGPLAP